MKTTFILVLLAGQAFAAQPVLARVTAKTLAELQAKDPMIRLVTPAEGSAKVARPENQSIIKQSTILHDGTNWTLVPKGALLYIPAALKSRVDSAPSGNLMPWLEFLTINRGWITTNEVTFQQASGSEEIPAERGVFWSKQDKIVIAVHQRGPISVRKNDSPPTLTQR